MQREEQALAQGLASLRTSSPTPQPPLSPQKKIQSRARQGIARPVSFSLFTFFKGS
jgi:hypothetical protein